MSFVYAMNSIPALKLKAVFCLIGTCVSQLWESVCAREKERERAREKEEVVEEDKDVELEEDFRRSKMH